MKKLMMIVMIGWMFTGCAEVMDAPVVSEHETENLICAVVETEYDEPAVYCVKK